MSFPNAQRPFALLLRNDVSTLSHTASSYSAAWSTVTYLVTSYPVTLTLLRLTLLPLTPPFTRLPHLFSLGQLLLCLPLLTILPVCIDASYLPVVLLLTAAEGLGALRLRVWVHCG